MISELPFNRVAECVGANNLMIKRWRKNALNQQFIFDEKSKTIRVFYKNWRAYGMEIQTKGTSTNVRMTKGPNSRWW
jgi:hypothetical protein